MAKSVKVKTGLPRPKSASKKSPSKYHLKHGKHYLKFIQKKRPKTIIKVSISRNLKQWVTLEKSLIESRPGYFDRAPIHILDAILIDEGILLLYYVKNPYALGAALFDKGHPDVLLWRTANPLYQMEKHAMPRKVIKSKRKMIIYVEKNKKIHRLVFFLDDLLLKLRRRYRPKISEPISVIQRSQTNPIIRPTLTHHWECCATFNAAAIYLADKVHLIYRAIGTAGMSVLGYASSKDGFHIDERLPDPVYLPREPFEFRPDNQTTPLFAYASGGGWGGCEDPRLTNIDDTIYMTYTAFNGSEPPGVALTSIKVSDFLNKQWLWKKPRLISPRGEINKNWVIFPEKINGKYAILHSISPDILISYFDRLNGNERINIRSRYESSSREMCWDTQIRGVGPPPIKTNAGWLVLYHAMDKRDPNRYKLGAMILDYKNPTKVLYRAHYPILEPDAYYENCGYKSGVIYSCGAVVINDQLLVYYGGADTVTCIATANLSQFLEQLKAYYK